MSIDIVKLIDLVHHTPEIKWNYEYLSSNPNISLEDIKIKDNDIIPFVKEELSYNPNLTWDWLYDNFLSQGTDTYKEWNWEGLSENMPLEDILEYPEFPWHMYTVSGRISDINIILEYPDFMWNWDLLSQNLPIDQIMEYTDFPWNYKKFNINKTLTQKFIDEHKDKSKFDWNYSKIVMKINLSKITENPDFLSNFDIMSRNPTLTSEFLLNHLDEDWDWNAVFRNSNIDFDILADSKVDFTNMINESIINGEDNEGEQIYYIDYASNLSAKFIRKYKDIFLTYEEAFEEIHENGILTLEDIKEDPELIVNHEYLSLNPNLTIDYVIANLDKPWNIENLSMNKGFKMKDILKGIEAGIEWSFGKLSQNPNITFNFIYENRNEKWNTTELSQNLFIEQKKISIKKFALNDILISDIGNIIVEY